MYYWVPVFYEGKTARRIEGVGMYLTLLLATM